ncbi:hypothetical protein NHJ13734_009621 [Beauveria thailandica]
MYVTQQSQYLGIQALTTTAECTIASRNEILARHWCAKKVLLGCQVQRLDEDPRAPSEQRRDKVHDAGYRGASAHLRAATSGMHEERVGEYVQIQYLAHSDEYARRLAWVKCALKDILKAVLGTVPQTTTTTTTTTTHL